MIKLVLFDLWGTLATKRRFVFGNIANTYGLDKSAFPMFLELLREMELGETTETHFWIKLFDGIGISRKSPVLSLADIYDEITIINNELLAVAKDLKNEGCKIAILSNTDPAAAAYLERNNILSEFDAAIFSFTARRLKPDNRIYIDTLEQLGTTSDETAYIDDDPACINAAKELGIHAILFKNTAQAKAELQALRVL